mmetsp:Transcript_39097/g.108745  ORF Transcript_39097/g.108745 Transcript_39097/m.108745 type:complete len:252 (-) Transcript_39097:34-789(-)
MIPHEGVSELTRGPIAATGATAMLGVGHAVHECLCGEPGARWRTTAQELRLHRLHGRDGPATAAVALLPQRRPHVRRQAALLAERGIEARGHGAAAESGSAFVQQGDGLRVPVSAWWLVPVQHAAFRKRPIHEGVDASLPPPALLRVPGVCGVHLRQRGLKDCCAPLVLLATGRIGTAEVADVLRERVALQGTACRQRRLGPEATSSSPASGRWDEEEAKKRGCHQPRHAAKTDSLARGARLLAALPRCVT